MPFPDILTWKAFLNERVPEIVCSSSVVCWGRMNKWIKEIVRGKVKNEYGNWFLQLFFSVYLGEFFAKLFRSVSETYCYYYFLFLLYFI